jgi:hypothetical protein
MSSYGREMGGSGAGAWAIADEGRRARAKTASAGGDGNGGLRDSGEDEWKRLTQGVVGATTTWGGRDGGNGRALQGEGKCEGDGPRAAPSPANGGVVRFAESEGDAGHSHAGGHSPSRRALVAAGAGGGVELPGYKVGLGGVAMDVGLDVDVGEPSQSMSIARRCGGKRTDGGDEMMAVVVVVDPAVCMGAVALLCSTHVVTFT